MITQILPIKNGVTKLGKDWAAIEFVVEENKPAEQYPQSGVFKMFKQGEYVKHVMDFEQYNKIGYIVDVEFNLKANEAGGRFFQSLDVWKINRLDAPTRTNTPVPVPVPSELENDLPF